MELWYKCSQGTSAFVLINFYVDMLKIFTEITFRNQPMKKAIFFCDQNSFIGW